MSLPFLDSYSVIDRLSITGIIIVLLIVDALHSFAFDDEEKIDACIVVIPVIIL